MLTKEKIIQIEKRYHRGAWQIFLRYDYKAHADIDRATRKLTGRKYSASHRQWYLPYTKEAYAQLKSLPFEIEVLQKHKKETPREYVNVDTSNSGTTAEIRPKGDNNGISGAAQQEKPRQVLTDREKRDGQAISKEPVKEHIVDSSTDHSKTTTTHGISTTTWINGTTEVSINAKWLSLKFLYEEAKVEQLKRIKGAWWHAKSRSWLLRPLPEHVERVQEIFEPFGKTEYERAYQIACSVSDPIVMEIYQTPEHPTKIAVKIRGYGVSTEFLKRLPGRNFDKTMKRWLIPRSDEVIERLLAHYRGKPGVMIKNRLTSRKTIQAREIDYGEKQTYLVSKYPESIRETVQLYTDTLIRMRYSWKTVTQYTSRFSKYLLHLGEKPHIETTTNDVNEYLSSIAKQKVSDSLLHSTVNAIKFYYEKVVLRQILNLHR